MELCLSGKRALVTGAGQGIGRAVAIELAKHGAQVIAVSRTSHHLQTLQQEVPDIIIVQLDVSKWEETERVITALLPIHLLVNNAGVASLEAVGEVTESEFNRVFGVNVKAALNISQIVAQGLREKGEKGAIVNISSQAATSALENHIVYCASKAALDQITKVMALELGPSKIRVNSVNPTVVLTEMGRKAWGDPEKSSAMKAKIPLGEFCGPNQPCFLIPTTFTMRQENDNTVMRMNTPVGGQPYFDLTMLNTSEDALNISECEDVVNAVLFLLSERAAMITGACLPIDGGYTVR